MRLEEDMPKEKLKGSSGHRERLKERFVRNSLNGFHDYEVLELLLTYAIPRRDTKPMAKGLIAKFKTFKGVLAASRQELEMIEGIGKQASVLIKIFNEIISYYFEENARNNEIQFTRLTELVEYFKATIGNSKNEILKAIYLNSQNKIIFTEEISEGTVSETAAFPRKVVEGALKHGATSVILGHNHPGGIAEPSEQDDYFTAKVKSALEIISISLQEHIIITEDNFFSYKKNKHILV
jgi:DNA repair protein RadC